MVAIRGATLALKIERTCLTNESHVASPTSLARHLHTPIALEDHRKLSRGVPLARKPKNPPSGEQERNRFKAQPASPTFARESSKLIRAKRV